MTIYLDLLFILNFLFDYVIISSVNYILRRNIKYYRIIIASLFGNVSLLLFNVMQCRILFVLFKLIICIFMNLIAFGFKDIKYCIKNIVYFYLVSMLIGGVVYFFDIQFLNSDDGLVLNNGNLFKYLIVIIISLLFYYKYLSNMVLLRNNYSYYYNCCIYIDDDNKIVVNAFLDTGNKLKDPYSNRDIVLVNDEMLVGFKVSKPIFVPYNSLNNHGLLTCFKAERIVINGKEGKNFLVGISKEKMFIDGIDCIISTSLMEGLR